MVHLGKLPVPLKDRHSLVLNVLPWCAVSRVTTPPTSVPVAWCGTMLTVSAINLPKCQNVLKSSSCPSLKVAGSFPRCRLLQTHAYTLTAARPARPKTRPPACLCFSKHILVYLFSSLHFLYLISAISLSAFLPSSICCKIISPEKKFTFHIKVKQFQNFFTRTCTVQNFSVIPSHESAVQFSTLSLQLQQTDRQTMKVKTYTVYNNINYKYRQLYTTIRSFGNTRHFHHRKYLHMPLVILFLL